MKRITPFVQEFILHWGELGTRWGINRTVAQIHALLYVSKAPLNAEEICRALGVARSNASNSLKELQNWGIVSVVHLPGDRRDHFESMKDVYEMFRVIVAERKRREIDPTLAMLRNCTGETSSSKEASDRYAKGKLEELRGFFEVISESYEKLDRLPTKSAVKAIKTGDKLLKAVGLFSN